MFGLIVRFLINLAKSKLIEKLGLKELFADPRIKRLIGVYGKVKQLRTSTLDAEITKLLRASFHSNNEIRRFNQFINKQINENLNLKRHILKNLHNGVADIVDNNPLLKQALEFKNNLKQFTPKNILKNKLNEISDEEINKFDIDEQSLNSTWIQSGIFYTTILNPAFGNSGNLKLTLNNNKSYTYFNVNQSTWEHMKAWGQGGSGDPAAGTTFWTEYLRNRYGAAPRRILKNKNKSQVREYKKGVEFGKITRYKSYYNVNTSLSKNKRQTNISYSKSKSYGKYGKYK